MEWGISEEWFFREGKMLVRFPSGGRRNEERASRKDAKAQRRGRKDGLRAWKGMREMVQPRITRMGKDDTDGKKDI
jgi:hypothetical protein